MFARQGSDYADCSVVVITRNRAGPLREALEHLGSLPERVPVIVVDNGSTDETASVIARAGPRTRAIVLQRNAGAAGRNVGVEHATTPYVAFSDDDSWWAPGALRRAVELFDRHPRLALIGARVLVGPGERLDPTCLEMKHSTLPRAPDLPGPSILGFIACGAIVQREAFLRAGGFHPRFEVGGEEGLLAIDLARAGWGLAYCEDIVAHHYPDACGERPSRRARMVRNDLWTAWLRRSAGDALAATASVTRAAICDAAARDGLAAALRGASWVRRERRPIESPLEAQLRLLQR
jgi:GT2 family glycosyltransferase